MRDERGPGARVNGTGFEPDTTVVLTISDRSRTTTFGEDQWPALRTDIRGNFILPIHAEPGDIGVATFEAAAGNCSAQASTEVTAAMFVSECPVAEPAASGGKEGAAYGALVLADLPFHYWRFEDAEGELAEAAAGEPARYRGAPTLAYPGVFDDTRAVGLDGVDDWIDITEVELPADFTIEAWIFLCGDSIGNEDGIVGQAGSGPDVNLYEERLRLFDGRGDPAVASRPVDAGRWVHVAVIRLGDAVTLLMDGDEVGAGRYRPAFPIAAIGWGNAGFFQGAIDEVAIYDHALTVERLAQHAAAGGR